MESAARPSTGARQRSRLLFRGEASDGHRLHSTFDRAVEQADIANAVHLEEVLYRSFQREAHLRLPAESVPGQADVLEWLAVMRHYGAPTRLLDWTYSPWIALFFAAAGARSNGRAAVWMIDDAWMQEAATALLRRGKSSALTKFEKDLHCREPETFYRVYVHRPRAFVQKQNTWRRNPRIIAQQGCFLCPGDIRFCVQSNLGQMLHEHPPVRGSRPIQRVVFEAALARDILERLDTFGINYASLYPDLEGIGKDLTQLPRIRRRHASELEMQGIGGPPPKRRPRS